MVTRSHAPAWECGLGRSASSSISVAGLKDDAERRRRHFHGGPWERGNRAKRQRSKDFAILTVPDDRFIVPIRTYPLAIFLRSEGKRFVEGTRTELDQEPGEPIDNDLGEG
jgi:hypothetical protein